MKFTEKGRGKILACMSSLVKTDAEEMEYEVAPCQRMSEKEIGDDVLAIALATSILYGIDPVSCYFNSPDIRKHLFDCFA